MFEHVFDLVAYFQTSKREFCINMDYLSIINWRRFIRIWVFVYFTLDQ